MLSKKDLTILADICREFLVRSLILTQARVRLVKEATP